MGVNAPMMFATGARRSALAAAALLALAGCGMFKKAEPEAPLQMAAVERRTISLSVEATGTVEPIDLVEVKSKASGQILRMPVEVGSVVGRGDLLAQIDKVDVQNAYDQAAAALEAARTRVRVAEAQKKRSDDLLAGGVITAQEHETAELDHANAQSALVQARTNLDNARQRLEDATVRAPIAGTVLEQPVATGQVISSATSSVSGGTTLLKMADLSRIRMRVLVPESDIGNVKMGLPATVTVDAYPTRQFRGEVEKIEPQAVVQQSVTMFPVLVSLTNEDGLLLPGMNGEVTMLVARQDEVLAVPVDALRTMRDLETMAAALGLDPEQAQADVTAQIAAFAGGADSARAGANGAVRGADGTRGAQAGANGAGRRGGAGAAGGQRMGANGRRFAAGGRGGTARNAPQIAFVQTPAGFAIRAVNIGISDYEYTQVAAGLAEGDQVLLLSVTEIQAERSELTERIRSRMGSGLTTSGSGGGSGSGAARPGGR
jgi:HlyD family secretion protein